MGCCSDSSQRTVGRKNIPINLTGTNFYQSAQRNNIRNGDNENKVNKIFPGKINQLNGYNNVIIKDDHQKFNNEKQKVEENNKIINQNKIVNNKNNEIENKKENKIEEKRLEIRHVIELQIEESKQGHDILKGETNVKGKREENKIFKKVETIKGLENTNSLKLDKDLCKSIASSLPRRKETDYQSLKDIMKSKTKKLSLKEKSYIIFLWICDNISYDIDSYYAGRDVDCTPEGVFKNGSSICSGYSRLFKDISIYLNLEVECVSCYAKGAGYYVGQKLTKTDHEYNVIKLNNKWYPIDCTWGAGHVTNKEFIKSYNEFYFFVNPELLIKTHFPEDDKWQLTNKKYTLDEFLKWPQVKSNFYQYGFDKYYPEEGVIELKNKNIQKFIIYGPNMEQKAAMCNIYLLEDNCYKQQLTLSLINYYNNRFEVNARFNKKGKYKIEIYGNDGSEEKYHDIIEYAANVDKDAIRSLSFPKTYKGSENINVIEPLYDNLRAGEKVNFKMTSNYDDIIIIDDDWHYIKRNEDGYFEFETQIKTQKGKKVIIGYKDSSGNCSYQVEYKVI